MGGMTQAFLTKSSGRRPGGADNSSAEAENRHHYLSGALASRALGVLRRSGSPSYVLRAPRRRRRRAGLLTPYPRSAVRTPSTSRRSRAKAGSWWWCGGSPRRWTTANQGEGPASTTREVCISDPGVLVSVRGEAWRMVPPDSVAIAGTVGSTRGSKAEAARATASALDDLTADLAARKAPSSLSPTSNASTSRCPSAATPAATRTAWDTTRWSTRALQ